MRHSGQTEQWEKECARARFLIHQNFGSLEFKEDTHQYFLPQMDGTKVEYDCVSHFTKQWDFTTEEDWCRIRENYAKKNGHDAEYWKRLWDENASRACKNGTIVHEFAESCGWLSNGETDKICESAKSQYNPDTYEMIPCGEESKWFKKDDGSDDWLRWVRKEEAAKQFYDDLLGGKYPGLHFCMAETKVYTSVGKYCENYKRNYAGTFDLLLYYQHPTDEEKSGFCIFDWKTNHSLYSKAMAPKYLLKPFDDFVEEDKSHYTLQLSCYQIPLEAIGLKVIARRLIHLKDEGGYELISLPDVTDRLKNVLRGK